MIEYVQRITLDTGTWGNFMERTQKKERDATAVLSSIEDIDVWDFTPAESEYRLNVVASFPALADPISTMTSRRVKVNL